MNKRKKIIFILNTNAGHGKATGIVKQVESKLDASQFEIQFTETEFPGHAKLLAKTAADQKFDFVGCVGGDGTVNEIASSLINTETCMVIIPTGSGNGLARHLKIPMQPAKAIALLNNAHIIRIDTFSVNNLFAVNVAGVGFDALVAHRFSEKKKRGLKTYINTVIKELKNSNEFEAEVLGKTHKAWLISIANSGQFGNNAWIAPAASLSDGILDLVICKKVKAASLLKFAADLFLKQLKPSPHYITLKKSDFAIELSEAQPLHIDGEPAGFVKDVTIKCHPHSLKVIIPHHVE